MKKTIILLLSLLTSMVVFADSFDQEGSTTIDGIEYVYGKVTHDNGDITNEAKIKDGADITLLTLKIPPYIEVNNSTYDVTTICANAFEDNEHIEYVIIPENVVTIEKGAFQHSNAAKSKLRLIQLPSTLKSIGSNAFKNCARLGHIWLKNGNPVTLDANSFPGSFLSLYIPKASGSNFDEKWTARFGNRIYEIYDNDGEMEKISPAQSQTYICAKTTETGGVATLFEYDNDAKVTIPASFSNNGVTYSVKGIGSYSIKTPSKLKTLVINDGVEAIYNSAFEGCSALRRVTLPSTLDSIGTDAFKGCTGVSHIGCKVADPATLAGSVERFPNNPMMALYVSDDASYKSYQVEGVKIWSNRFNSRIYKGEMIEIPDNVNGITYIGSTNSDEVTLFSVTDKDVSDPVYSTNGKKLTGIDYLAFDECKKITNLPIPDNVLVIGPSAFNNCDALETIKFPSNLERIGKSAFSGCTKLVTVEFGSNNPPIIDKDLFNISNSSEKTLYVPDKSSYVGGGWDKFAYVMEGSVKENVPFGNMNFNLSSTSLEATLIKVNNGDKIQDKVTIPYFISYEGKEYVVSVIRKNAFVDIKSSLIHLSFEDNNNGLCNLSIGESALSGCTKLRLLRLPKRLKKISKNAFSSCEKLVDIEFRGTPSSEITKGETIFHANTRKYGSLYVPTGNGDYSALGWNLSIKRCDDVEEFQFPEGGMTYLGWKKNSAEMGETKLIIGANPNGSSTLNLPKQVTRTQSDNSEVRYSLVAIGENAFSGKSFTNLVIPEGVTKIGENAFLNNLKLKTVDLPSTLNEIGENAFNGCNLGTITSRMATPPVINTNVFLELITPDVYIPNSTSNTYIGVSGWARFQGKYLEGEIFDAQDVDKLMMIYNCRTGDHTATLIKINDTGILENNTLEILPTVTVLHGGKTDTFTVTEIGESVSQNNSDKGKIEVLDIKAAVTAIGANAFQNCTKLATIKLPSSLKSIGSSAFSGTKITELRLDSVESIGTGAFQNISSLKKVWLPSKLTSVGENAFAGCNALTHVSSSIASPSSVISADVFSVSGDNTSNICTLFVPYASKANYGSDWNKKFTNIIGGDYVDDLSKDGMTYSCYTYKNEGGDTVKSAL
ncbi:Leucine rich repeat-containing protein, partial [Xylanibacter ruminicola]